MYPFLRVKRQISSKNKAEGTLTTNCNNTVMGRFTSMFRLENRTQTLRLYVNVAYTVQYPQRWQYFFWATLTTCWMVPLLIISKKKNLLKKNMLTWKQDNVLFHVTCSTTCKESEGKEFDYFPPPNTVAKCI